MSGTTTVKYDSVKSMCKRHYTLIPYWLANGRSNNPYFATATDEN